MELLIEKLNDRIKEGYINYNSLIEILKIIGDMVENKTRDFSFIEEKIIMIMINILGKQKDKDIEATYSDSTWEDYKKYVDASYSDAVIENTVNEIKQHVQNEFFGSDVIDLLLAFKRSFERTKKVTKMWVSDMNDIYDYMAYIAGLVCGNPDYNFNDKNKKFKKLIPATNSLHFK